LLSHRLAVGSKSRIRPHLVDDNVIPSNELQDRLLSFAMMPTTPPST